MFLGVQIPSNFGRRQNSMEGCAARLHVPLADRLRYVLHVRLTCEKATFTF
jgi:hypothetical protein